MFRPASISSSINCARSLIGGNFRTRFLLKCGPKLIQSLSGVSRGESTLSGNPGKLAAEIFRELSNSTEDPISAVTVTTTTTQIITITRAPQTADTASQVDEKMQCLNELLCPNTGTGPVIELLKASESSYLPPGIDLTFLAYLHDDIGLPWWGSIVVGVAVGRLLFRLQRNQHRRDLHKCYSNFPEMQELNQKRMKAMQDLKLSEAAEYAQDMKTFLDEKKKSPSLLAYNLSDPLYLGPVILGFTLGIGKLVHHVDTMKMGGMLWFTDLTVPDPYFILPIVAGALWFGTEVCRQAISVESSSSGNSGKPVKKNGVGNILIPVAGIVPVLAILPAAYSLGWIAIALISLGEVLMMLFRIHKSKSQEVRRPLWKGKQSWDNFCKTFSRLLATKGFREATSCSHVFGLAGLCLILNLLVYLSILSAIIKFVSWKGQSHCTNNCNKISWKLDFFRKTKTKPSDGANGMASHTIQTKSKNVQ